MSREKDLAKNTLVLSLGKFLPKVMSFITLPIVTACLTKAEYGTYDLVNTLVMLIIPVATLQIHSAAFRFLIDVRKDREKSAAIISCIYTVTIPVSILVCIGIILFMPLEDMTAKVLIGIYFVADTLQLATGQVTRGLGFNKYYSAAAVLLSLTEALGIILMVALLDRGLTGVMVSLVVSNVVAFLFQAKKASVLSYFSLKRVSGPVIKELIGYSWPMVPNNLSNWVLKLSDRLVITAVLGVEANAVYAVANKIPNILSIAQSVLVMAWHENASMAVGDADSSTYYSRMFDRIFSLVISLTALLISFTPLMFCLLIRGDYDDAYIQMPILILGMFFYCMSSFQGGIYIAHKKTRSVGITTMVAAGINLLIDVLLVRVIGITAGSLSTLIAYFVLYVYRQVDVQKLQKVDFHVKKQILYLALIAGMLFLCFLRNTWVNVLNVLIGLVFFYILNRDLVRSLPKEGKRMIEKYGKKRK